MQVFFSDDDRRRYLTLFAFYARKYEVDLLSFTLMPNHVHHLVVPPSPRALSRVMQFTHREFARAVNERFDWSGHLWQERFYSSPVDPEYLMTVLRYIEQNPVRAELAPHPELYEWSSAAVRSGRSDVIALATTGRWVEEINRIREWDAWLRQPVDEKTVQFVRDQTWRDLPVGSPEFISRLERQTGQCLRPRPVGRPPGRGRAVRRGKSSEDEGLK